METKRTNTEKQEEKAELSWADNKEGGLKNWPFTRHIDGKMNRRRQSITNATKLCKWLAE